MMYVLDGCTWINLDHLRSCRYFEDKNDGSRWIRFQMTGGKKNTIDILLDHTVKSPYVYLEELMEKINAAKKA